MAQIATTTNSTPFEAPGPSRISVDADGSTLWAVSINSAGTGIAIYKSTDSGGSWTLRGTFSPGVTVLEVSGIEERKVGLNFAYRTNESSQDRIYIKRAYDGSPMTFSASTGSLVLSASNGGVAGSVYSGLSNVVSFVQSNGYHWLVCAVGQYGGGAHGARMFATRISPSGVYQNNTSEYVWTRRSWTVVGTGKITPYLAMSANGSLLYCVYGRDTVRAVRAGWNGNGWSGPLTDIEISSTVGTSQDSIAATLGNSFFHIAVPDGDDPTRIKLIERTNSWGTHYTRAASNAHPTGNIRYVSVSWNSTTNDIRVYAVGTSTSVLYFCDYVRASGTWTSWSTVVATAILGGDNFSSRPLTTYTGRHDVVYAHSGAPNTLNHTRQIVGYSPNPPAWAYGTTANSSPSNGSSKNVSAALDLVWTFSDPDTGDAQSAYALRRQIGAGAFAYFRASDSTWQATEQKNVSGTASRTLASGWALDADADYSFSVKVWDSADLASTYSAAQVVKPSALVNPVITAPTGTITTATAIATWTASQQQSFRASLSIQGGAQLYTSGWLAQAATRSFTFPTVLPDGFLGTVTIETTNNEGLPSTAITSNFTVDYVEPAVPTLVATPDPANGTIDIVIANPTPGGGQPAIDRNQVYRRRVSTPDQISTTVVLLDDFTRSVSDSLGGVWTTSGGAGTDYDVNGTAATISCTSTLVARSGLALSNVPDVDQIVHVSTGELAVGGNQEAALFARRLDDNNLYIARLKFNTNQTVFLDIQKRVAGVQSAVTADVNTGLTHGVNTVFGLHLLVIGTRLVARAWLASGAEPTTWTVDGTDTSLPAAGTAGIRAILGSGHTNLPVLFTFDNYQGSAVAGIEATERPADAVVNNGTYEDFTARSGVLYEYQIKAIGTNGTFSVSAWTQ